MVRLELRVQGSTKRRGVRLGLSEGPSCLFRPRARKPLAPQPSQEYAAAGSPKLGSVDGRLIVDTSRAEGRRTDRVPVAWPLD